MAKRDVIMHGVNPLQIKIEHDYATVSCITCTLKSDNSVTPESAAKWAVEHYKKCGCLEYTIFTGNTLTIEEEQFPQVN